VRVLALNAYHGGSHRDFIDRWSGGSRHAFTVLTLPPRHWKWRMRHAAVHFASEAQRLTDGGATFDAVVCTDMLNLAEFAGLCPAPIARLPRIAYFHENQLAYPTRGAPDERDAHYALTNLTTALAADRAWFNSAFNRDSMVDGLAALVDRMPDHRPFDALHRVRSSSEVQPPPIGDDAFAERPRVREPGQIRLAWAARWEHDKGPATLFAALGLLAERGVEFRVSVLGEQRPDADGLFGRARAALGDRIDAWGFLPDRTAYLAALRRADVFISTASHEFFGIAAVEAVAAGAMPVVPGSLAYPETLAGADGSASFHDGSAASVAGLVGRAAARLAAAGAPWPDAPTARALADRIAPLAASRRVPDLDVALERTVGAALDSGGPSATL